MLDYGWGNPSAIMLSGDEPTQDSDQSRHIFDHYTQTFNEANMVNPNSFTTQNHQHFIHQQNTQTQLQNQAQAQFQSLYDPRAYGSSYQTLSPSLLSLEPAGATGYMVVPKSEPVNVDFTSRIGLNLGGRTYFSSSEDDFVNRLYRRSRGIEPGSVNSPRCQAEGCNADLTQAKHYHRRHKVCEFHSKAATVIAAGLTQRFCQQCSRFHILSEFDNGKRSCRRRLADHNRRRRKSNQTTQEQYNKSQLENARDPSSENLARSSPPDSGLRSSSSVTVAISPPRMSLDCFGRQRSYHAGGASASTNSFFFSSG